MSGGPFAPKSIQPVSGDRTFKDVYVGKGANGLQLNGPHIKASIGSNSIWHLLWQMPNVLPSGTPKLRLSSFANAEAGDAKVNPTWNRSAGGSDLSSLSLTAEGVSTITWGAGDDDVAKVTKIDLDAETIMASDFIVMQLIFETSGWTLAANSLWLPDIVFED